MRLTSASLLHNDAHGEDAMVRRARGRLFAVMDGVSGADGKAASEHLRRRLQKARLRTGRGTVRVLHQLHRELLEKHGGNAQTTIALALVRDERVTVCNVGDSPAMLIRNGQRAATILTTADNDPEHANVLTQAIGADNPTIHVTTHPFMEGDTLLLMTDGISDNIRADTLAALVQEHPNVDTIVKNVGKLITTAKTHDAGRVYEDFKEDDRALIAVRATPNRTSRANQQALARSENAA